MMMRAPAAAAPSDVTIMMRAASCHRVPASIPVAFLHRCGERRTSGGGTHHSGVGDVARVDVDRASVCAVRRSRVPMKE